MIYWENIEIDILTKHPVSFMEVYLRNRLYPIFNATTIDEIIFLSNEKGKLLEKRELLRQGQPCEELPNLTFKGFKI